MAQLVKLLDYISRYENDLSRYPTQYIRLKRYQWERMKTQWENGMDLTEWQQGSNEEVEETEEVKWFSSLFRRFSKRKSDSEDEDFEREVSIKELQEDIFDFNPNIVHTPSNLEQLRKLYLDQLFHFQIKWASSTLMDKSRVDSRYMRDPILRSFTQLLPDNYLMFYYPILMLKQAPVELEIVIVTPIECMCITVLEQENLAAFIGNSDRFWVKKLGDKESKLLNPIIGLTRMEKIVSGIFKMNEIDFPVKKYMISRNGYIDYPGMAFDTDIVDRRTYDKWFSSLRKSAVPMKSTQFKAAQAILDVGQTTAMSRLFKQDEEKSE